MSEIDLSEVVNDSTLAEEYTIQRLTGSFQFGGFVPTTTSISGYGVVSVATEEDLQMVPEGDRVTGSMVFHSEQRIYETQLDANGSQKISDQIIWNYQLYRILHVGPYPNRNYWKAIGARMSGR
jgi:hypothetical protein